MPGRAEEMIREKVYELIDGERDYQQRVWDGLNGEADNPLTEGEFVLLLEAYIVKARTEWQVEEKPAEKTLDMVRKVAGIAVNCMEQHGAPARK